jgi:transcriptional regulator
MYIPAQFKSEDLNDAIAVMKAHSFAALIANDDQGWPFVTYLPLHVETVLAAETVETDTAETPAAPAPDAQIPDAQIPAPQVPAPQVVLYGHVAKANPHWRYLRDRGTAVASFLGPHAYMSPRVYPDSKRVPTWNYLAVECRATVRLIEGHDATDGMMVRLIDDYDPQYLSQWRSLDEHYVTSMMAGIVGFQLTVTEIQCKLKLNQHRPESHAAMREAYAGGNENERELVQWMDRLKFK